MLNAGLTSIWSRFRQAVGRFMSAQVLHPTFDPPDARHELKVSADEPLGALWTGDLSEGEMTGFLDRKLLRLSLDGVAEKWANETGEPKAHQLLLLYEAALAGELEFPVHERNAAPLHPSTVEDDKGEPHTVLVPTVGLYRSALSLANRWIINAAQLARGLDAASGAAGSHTASARERAARDIFVTEDGLRRWFVARGEPVPAFLANDTGPADEHRATKAHRLLDAMAGNFTFARGELTHIAKQLAGMTGYKPDTVQRIIVGHYHELKAQSQATKVVEPVISENS